MVNLIKWLKTAFLSVFGAFLREVFDAAKAKIIAELKDFAYVTVKDLNLTNLLNDDKRKVAILHIKEEARARGIELKDSLAALIVEMALTKLKNVLEEAKNESV
jgi:hypothetical protein